MSTFLKIAIPAVAAVAGTAGLIGYRMMNGFLLRHEPEIKDGGVCAGAIRLSPDRPMTIGIEEIPVTDPRMARNYPGSLWRVTFGAKEAAQHRLGFWIGER